MRERFEEVGLAAQFVQRRRGHLAPGILGDVTILSGDVISATADEIRAMTVIATIVGGAVGLCWDEAVCEK